MRLEGKDARVECHRIRIRIRFRRGFMQGFRSADQVKMAGCSCRGPFSLNTSWRVINGMMQYGKMKDERWKMSREGLE